MCTVLQHFCKYKTNLKKFYLNKNRVRKIRNESKSLGSNDDKYSFSLFMFGGKTKIAFSCSGNKVINKTPYRHRISL